jgi:tRNA modification GTPase
VDAVSFGGDVFESDPNALTIVTKCDLASQPVAFGFSTSALTGAGLDALAAELRTRLLELTAEANSGMVAATSARCEESLQAAHDGFIRLRELLEQAAGEELLAAELRDILTNLGRVVGAIYTDDILDQVFRRFCIGK